MNVKHPRRARFGFIAEIIIWSLFATIFAALTVAIANADSGMHKPTYTVVSALLAIICIIGWIDARRDHRAATDRDESFKRFKKETRRVYRNLYGN